MQGIKGVFTKSALAAVVAAGVFLPGEAAACGPESYVGTVCYMATNFCPRGTLPADGRVMQVSQNQVLFSLMGASFGGDGRTTFNLPDLRGRAAIGTGAGTNTLQPTVTLGQLVGQAIQSFVVPLPQHTHSATFTPKTVTAGTGSTAINVPAVAGGGLAVTGLSVSSTPNLSATTKGSVKIASSAAGLTSAPANGAVLAKPGLSAPNIYNASAAADTTIGPEQTFSGAVSGTVTSTITGGTVTGTPTIPSFDINVPNMLTHGDVTVQQAGNPAPVITVSTQTPAQGFSACIVTDGVYPSRP